MSVQYCDEHKQHSSQIITLQENVKTLFTEINSTIKLRLFLFTVGVLITFMTVIGGTQVKIMTTLSTMEERLKHIQQPINLAHNINKGDQHE